MALSTHQRRDLRLLTTFRGISFVGDAVALVTLYLRLAHHGSGWSIAALSVAGALPLVIWAPLAGFVVDRVNAKSFLCALGLLEAAICVALGYWHSSFATIALMALLTSAVAFSSPGYAALVPFVAGEENVAHAQSMVQSIQGVALAGGPVIGGLLVAAIGTSGPLYVDGASFAAAALATLALHTDRRPAPRPESEHEPHRLSAGFRLVGRDPILRSLVVTFVTILLCIGAINVVEVFFITRSLHGSALDYGLVGASFGAGTIGGALYARRLSQDPNSLLRTTLVNVFVVSLLLGTVGLCEHVGYVFPLMVAMGLVVGVINVAGTTLFTVRTPESLRGRVFAATGALFTSAELSSAVLGGLLVSVVAPRTVFFLAGGFSVVAVGAVASRELRRSRGGDAVATAA